MARLRIQSLMRAFHRSSSPGGGMPPSVNSSGLILVLNYRSVHRIVHRRRPDRFSASDVQQLCPTWHFSVQEANTSASSLVYLSA